MPSSVLEGVQKEDFPGGILTDLIIIRLGVALSKEAATASQESML